MIGIAEHAADCFKAGHAAGVRAVFKRIRAAALLARGGRADNAADTAVACRRARAGNIAVIGAVANNDFGGCRRVQFRACRRAECVVQHETADKTAGTAGCLYGNLARAVFNQRIAGDNTDHAACEVRV